MKPTLPARQHSASHRSGRATTHKHMQLTLLARQVGIATTHKHMQPTLPARPHFASHRSGNSHNTQTHAADSASHTGLGKLPVREEPQHTNTRSRPCRPDRTRQVTGQGRATTHKHMQPILQARPHSASHRSGKSHNTNTCSRSCTVTRDMLNDKLTSPHDVILHPKHYDLQQQRLVRKAFKRVYTNTLTVLLTVSLISFSPQMKNRK